MRHENYRILVSGHNATVLDMFFYHMDYYEVQTTSRRTDDIRSHIQYFKPQAYVFTVMKDDYNGIKKIGSAKPYLMREHEIPCIFIGTSEDCAAVEKILPTFFDVYIEKPFTVAQIQEKIDDLIEMREDRINAEKQQEEDAKAELEAKKAALEKEKEELEQEEKEVKKSAGTGKEVLSGDMDLDIASLMELVKKDSRRKHVLVIDDDSGMLKVIKEHLKEDYDVATAISGKLARKFLEKKKTDLILLDYMMPGEDGPAVLKSFRQNPETKNLPVVFLTGMTEREKIIELLKSEDRPQGYIVKPVEKDKLIAEIKNLIG